MMRKNTKKISSKKRSPPLHEHPSPDDYQMVLLWSEEDQCYVVSLPAWQNARTHGNTPQAAVKNGREVLTMLIDSALRHGEPIPAPEHRYSGNLRLRLPASLHGRLAHEAEREGVSLNHWIVSKLAG